MLVATPEDTLQIARMQWGPQDLLAASTLEEMRRLQLLDLHEGAPGGDWKLGYGLGWRLVRYGDTVFAGHGGGYVGNRCQLAVSPRHRIAVAVFANGNQALGTTELAYQLLRELVAALPPVASVQPAGREEEHSEAEPLLGYYFARYWHGVHIVWRNGPTLLYETDPANPVTLARIAEGRYRIGAGRDAGEELIAKHTNGEVHEVLIAGMTYQRV